MLKVRFISINDNIDVKSGTEVIENLEIPLKSLINEAYSYDISKKTKSAIYMKKERGEFIGISAPFGYLKDPNDKHKYIVDEEASKIVIKIFDMVLEGKTRREISDELNKLQMLTPGLYKINKELANYNVSNSINKWNPEMINRILRNRNYTGVLIQGIVKRVNYRNHKLVKTNQEDWIITENHHKAIISKEKFDKVQDILNRKISVNDILRSYLICADCGSKFHKKKTKYNEYYYCNNYYRTKKCSSHSIIKSMLEEMVLENLENRLNKEIKELTKELVEQNIKQIIVYENGKVEFEYKN